MDGQGMGIDLNSDMGESYGRWSLGDDRALLGVVSSANIACGFHAGDPAGILGTVTDAVRHGVTIGAHVSYNDLAGFGRRFVDEQPRDLTAEIIYQIGALQALAATVGGSVRYVKPHGALYNRIVDDRRHAAAVVDAISAMGASIGLLTLPGSVVGEMADKAGIAVYREAFADRAYTPEGRLVPRTRPGAVISDVDAVTARVRDLVTTGHITAIDGSRIAIEADSVCVHADSPGALEMAGAIRRQLSDDGVTVTAFAGTGRVRRRQG
jgi:UPF0271 protein